MESSAKNILIVDDDPLNRELLRALLEAEQINVFEAADGIEALAVLEREPVEAIITDVLMPRMDGYRLCSAVRASKRLCSLPFIFYTNTYTSLDDEKTGLSLGADKFLRKPATVNEILAALRALEVKPQPAPSGQLLPPRGLELMNEYSEVLVRKLAEKNSELQLTTERLAQTNLALSDQARELEQAREELLNTNAGLERHVRERTAELEAANQELQAFSHSVAHDLRAPLRAIDGYTRLVMREFSAGSVSEATKYHERVLQATREMNQLIDALLKLCHLSHCDLTLRPVDLSRLARVILSNLQGTQPERKAEIVITPEIIVRGDEPLLRIALENLLSNAWKFTGKRECTRIEFGLSQNESEPTCFVRDNGAGFDMAYVDKLFNPGQRLHSQSDFSGSGIGMATARRIIQRHGGLIWAEGVVGQGATFYFTLNNEGGEKHLAPAETVRADVS